MSSQLTRLIFAVTLMLGVFDKEIVADDLSPKDFQQAKTVGQALEVVRQSLTRDAKSEYVPLLSEERVREAIRTAITSYESHIEKDEQKRPGTKKYFTDVLKPIYLKIADEGKWPENCSFFSFYKLTAKRDGRQISYDGLGLRLQVETPGESFKGFAIPVVDLFYGRFWD